MARTKHACPECGNADHLYRNAELRYQPRGARWEPIQVNDLTECTNCDWSGDVTETERKDSNG